MINFNVNNLNSFKEKPMHVISDSCVSCGACEPVCPVQAIAPGSGKYDISSSCIDCGACVSVCPVSAISAG